MECQFYSDNLVNNGSRQQVEFVDVIENRMSFRTKSCYCHIQPIFR